MHIDKSDACSGGSLVIKGRRVELRDKRETRLEDVSHADGRWREK